MIGRIRKKTKSACCTCGTDLRSILWRPTQSTKQQREVDGNASIQQQIFILCSYFNFAPYSPVVAYFINNVKYGKDSDWIINFYFQTTFFLLVVIKNLPNTRKVWKQKEAFEALIFAARFNKWQWTRQRLWLLRKPRKCA